MNDNIATPFAKPLYVMLKPAGAHCNLDCKYCYYLEKNNLYNTSAAASMTDEMLEQFTRNTSSTNHESGTLHLAWRRTTDAPPSIFTRRR